VAAVLLVPRLILPERVPSWGAFAGADGTWPVVAVALGGVRSFLVQGAVLLVAFVSLDRLTRAWTRRRVVGFAVPVAVALALAGSAGPFDLAEWGTRGAVLALAALLASALVLRFDVSLVPAATAGLVALGLVGDALRDAHFAAVSGSIAGAVAVVLLGAWWSRRLAGEGGSVVAVAAPPIESPPILDDAPPPVETSPIV
jgi:hypothetical protein